MVAEEYGADTRAMLVTFHLLQKTPRTRQYILSFPRLDIRYKTAPMRIVELFLFGLDDRCQNAVVAWELQSWESHVFDVLLFPSVVFPRVHNFEVILRKENKVLGVDVTLSTLLVSTTSLVELRLQKRPGVVRSVV